MDLDRRYLTIHDLVVAVRLAKRASGNDNRLHLLKDAFFEDDARPAVGAGSSADRNWMYEITGAMILCEDDHDTQALVLLMKAVQPKRKLVLI